MKFHSIFATIISFVTICSFIIVIIHPIANLNVSYIDKKIPKSIFQDITTLTDSYEPDNNFSTAIQINNSQILEKSISPIGDQDYFYFNLTTNTSVTIETNGVFDGDTVLYLYDENYTLLLEHDDIDFYNYNRYSRLRNVSLKNGLYFLKVEEFDNDEIISNYNISFLTKSLDLQADAYEPNDVWTQSTFIEINSTQNHSIHLYDTDIFKFRLNSDAMINIETNNHPISEKTILELYDNKSINGLLNKENLILNKINQIDYFPLEKGTYYLLIAEDGNNDVIPIYTLNITSISIIGDNYEPNNIKNQSKQIIGNSTLNLSINPKDDIDFFFFTLNKFSKIDIVTTGEIAQGTRLYLYNENLSIIKYDIVTINDIYLNFTNTLLKSGLYYIAIKSNGNSNAFNYTLNLEIVEFTSVSYEPNNDFEHATPISVNTTQMHSIETVGDIDMFEFSLDVESVITIETNGLTGDTKLILFDEQKNLLIEDDDSGEKQFSLIKDFDLDPGKYFISVQEVYNTSTIETYIITLSSSSDLDPNEPNDNFSKAIQLEVNSTHEDSISKYGDQDYYFFVLTEMQMITIETNGTIGGDTEIFLYNATLSLIESNDDGFEEGRYSKIKILLEPGEYYILVEDYNNNDLIEFYTIIIVSTDHEILGLHYEPNNSFQESTKIQMDKGQTHSIYPQYDTDYFNLELSSDGYLTVDIYSEEGDLIIDLYDFEEKELEYAEYYFNSYYLEKGVYFIRIRADVSNKIIYSYTIKVSFEPNSYLEDDTEFFIFIIIIMIMSMIFISPVIKVLKGKTTGKRKYAPKDRTKSNKIVEETSKQEQIYSFSPKCRNCGGIILKGDDYCAECGTRVVR